MSEDQKVGGTWPVITKMGHDSEIGKLQLISSFYFQQNVTV